MKLLVSHGANRQLRDYVSDTDVMRLCVSGLASVKGLSSREAARGHATNVDGIVLSVTINRIYNY